MNDKFEQKVKIDILKDQDTCLGCVCERKYHGQGGFSGVSWMIGSGWRVSFLSEELCEDGILEQHFPINFSLARDKEATVAESFSNG